MCGLPFESCFMLGLFVQSRKLPDTDKPTSDEWMEDRRLLLASIEKRFRFRFIPGSESRRSPPGVFARLSM